MIKRKAKPQRHQFKPYTGKTPPRTYETLVVESVNHAEDWLAHRPLEDEGCNCFHCMWAEAVVDAHRLYRVRFEKLAKHVADTEAKYLKAREGKA